MQAVLKFFKGKLPKKSDQHFPSKVCSITRMIIAVCFFLAVLYPPKFSWKEQIDSFFHTSSCSCWNLSIENSMEDKWHDCCDWEKNWGKTNWLKSEKKLSIENLKEEIRSAAKEKKTWVSKLTSGKLSWVIQAFRAYWVFDAGNKSVRFHLGSKSILSKNVECVETCQLTFWWKSSSRKSWSKVRMISLKNTFIFPFRHFETIKKSVPEKYLSLWYVWCAKTTSMLKFVDWTLIDELQHFVSVGSVFLIEDKVTRCST